MSFVALKILESLEHSRDSARFMFTGKDGHGELWVDNGKITRVEGCSVDSLNDYLTQDSVEVWLRPLESHNTIEPDKSSLSTQDLASDKSSVLRKQNASISKSDWNKYQKTKENLFPATDKPDKAITETSSFPLYKIAEAVDPDSIQKRPTNPALKTQPYHSICFTDGSPERKTLGRGKQCDIVLADTEVSRSHCEIVFDGKKIHVFDMDSTNGTYLNNQHISDPLEARSHDLIRAGNSICMLLVV